MLCFSFFLIKALFLEVGKFINSTYLNFSFTSAFREVLAIGATHHVNENLSIVSLNTIYASIF